MAKSAVKKPKKPIKKSGSKSQVKSTRDFIEKEMNLGGRPRAALDFNDENAVKELNYLVALQCGAVEVAARFDVSEDTLDLRLKEKFGIGFTEYFKKNRAIGLTTLRAKQFQSAIMGDVKMQIHLGKTMLGQIDKVEVDNKSSDGSMQPKTITRIVVDGKDLNQTNDNLEG